MANMEMFLSLMSSLLSMCGNDDVLNVSFLLGVDLVEVRLGDLTFVDKMLDDDVKFTVLDDDDDDDDDDVM